MSHIACRHAYLEDSEDLFQWRNDPQTRAASISTDEVSWNNHEKWFDAMLGSNSRTIYIAIDNGGSKMGMCRFDTLPEGVEVSINLNPALRGKGLAKPILEKCIDTFIQEYPEATTLFAQIRVENSASIRIFEQVGFRPMSESNGVRHFCRMA